MLLAFPSSSSVLLGNCTPKVTPKVMYTRLLLSSKFSQAPYPGGGGRINSKLGKSQGLSRCLSTRAQGPTSPGQGRGLKGHSKSSIQKDNVLHPVLSQEGSGAATMGISLLLTFQVGAVKTQCLSAFLFLFITLWSLNFGKMPNSTKKQILLSSKTQ